MVHLICDLTMKNIIEILHRRNDKSTVYLNKRIIAHINYNPLMAEWCAEYKKDLIYGDSRDDVIDILLEKEYDRLQN
jgi:hypothetical protein